MSKKIIAFLKLNGFKKMESNSYANSNCNVVFENSWITVADNYGQQIANASESLFWLIGVLTYEGLINKHYKQ
mgnify:CR=1